LQELGSAVAATLWVATGAAAAGESPVDATSGDPLAEHPPRAKSSADTDVMTAVRTLRFLVTCAPSAQPQQYLTAIGARRPFNRGPNEQRLVDPDRVDQARGLLVGHSARVAAALRDRRASGLEPPDLLTPDGAHCLSWIVLILALPNGKDSTALADVLIDNANELPAMMRKTLTWDQGSEMAKHAAFSLATLMPVFFAHAHSPWERGTNENTNGLIRAFERLLVASTP